MPENTNELRKLGVNTINSYVNEGLHLIMVIKYSILGVAIAVIGGIGYAVFS